MYNNIVRVSACVTDTGFEVPDKFVVGYALVSNTGLTHIFWKIRQGILRIRKRVVVETINRGQLGRKTHEKVKTLEVI